MLSQHCLDMTASEVRRKPPKIGSVPPQITAALLTICTQILAVKAEQALSQSMVMNFLNTLTLLPAADASSAEAAAL